MADVPTKKKGWSTGKKIVIGIGITVAAFFVLIIGLGAYFLSTGQIPDSMTNPDESAAPKPVVQNSNADRIFGISEFGVLKQGSIYQAHFQLSDSNLAPQTANARIEFSIATVNSKFDFQTSQIVDNVTTIYSSSFNIKESDFGDYTRSFTGAAAGKMYLWVIDGAEIEDKTGGETSGKALITVTLENGKSFKADDSVFFG